MHFQFVLAIIKMYSENDSTSNTHTNIPNKTCYMGVFKCSKRRTSAFCKMVLMKIFDLPDPYKDLQLTTFVSGI